MSFYTLLRTFYLDVLSAQAKRFVTGQTFSVLLVFFIVLYSALSGVMTVPNARESGFVLFLSVLCVSFFVAEVGLKLVAEGTAPLNYFKDAYNVFDFVLAVAGVATIAESGSQNPIISLARMLRMVQLFKLAHNLPRLQLVTEALVYGVKSMIWVALLLFLFNYLFGLLGLVLFRDNDVRSCLIFVLCCAWIVPRTYLYSTKSNDAHFLSLLLRSSHSRSTLGTSGGRPRRSGASSR